MSAKAIQRLDEAVVNRIAAGEVIQRPANAIKELLENCLDAKSTNIQVTVKDGGLKLLQIQDNGTGIRREDMEIVCERFTTSKLEKFEDLGTISTYGFRGEALASITHIAHVTITTRTNESKCAYKGSYIDGKLKDSVKPCAGNTGTQILVEDLFFNVPTRRRALKSVTEEHQKISEVISKYAIHNSSVGFTLKKQGDGGNADVKTSPSSSHIDNIRIIYGATIARELLELNVLDERLSFKAHGFVSNANYSTKKPTFILFINHRLVDSTCLRRAIDSVYAAYLPKHTHPFVYLSLEINPRNVDVNVHPTKHEVHFLHEEAVIEAVQKAIDSRLLGSNSSRTFYLQNMLPSATAVVPAKDLLDAARSANSSNGGNVDNKVTANHMIRTDSRERKLDAFFNKFGKDQAPGLTAEVGSASSSAVTIIDHQSDQTRDSTKYKSTEKLPDVLSGNSSSVARSRTEQTQAPIRCNVRLTSVLSLRDDIDSDSHSGLRLVLADHTFCGIVSPELALIQHQTKLYLANTTRLSREFFYQRILNEFGNMGVMRLSEKAPLYDLAMLALDSSASGWMPSDGPKEELAQFAVQLLISKADMLRQYFSIDVDSAGNLTSLPLLLDKYIPAMEGLPMYILRLATEVEWDSERGCFETFASETSAFFAVSNEWLMGDAEDEETGRSTVDESISMNDSQSSDINISQSHDQCVTMSSQTNESCEFSNSFSLGSEKIVNSTSVKSSPSDESWKWVIEHVLYPAMRSELLPPKRFSEDGTLLQIANLPDLYKVFERC